MITVKKLKELLVQLPDDAAIIAYEGEGIGLIIKRNNASGWIEAGPDWSVPEEEWRHDLSEFGIVKIDPPPIKRVERPHSHGSQP